MPAEPAEATLLLTLCLDYMCSTTKPPVSGLRSSLGAVQTPLQATQFKCECKNPQLEISCAGSRFRRAAQLSRVSKVGPQIKRCYGEAKQA